MTKKSQPVAYSYVRFSSPEQAKGDSLRRQFELRDAWVKRTGAILDNSLTLRDEGVSAFNGTHRGNPDRHALAAFLELVRSGRIARGSYLVGRLRDMNGDDFQRHFSEPPIVNSPTVDEAQ